VDKALKLFENTSDWPDMINSLGKLGKVCFICLSKFIRLFRFRLYNPIPSTLPKFQKPLPLPNEYPNVFLTIRQVCPNLPIQLTSSFRCAHESHRNMQNSIFNIGPRRSIEYASLPLFRKSLCYLNIGIHGFKNSEITTARNLSKLQLP
jgi:hypothetical protein